MIIEVDKDNIKTNKGPTEMSVTLIKDGRNPSREVSSSPDHILNSQKLILSTSIQRFTPFSHVLVPFGTGRHALCRIIKKPDLHEKFCYLNTNVVCVGGDTLCDIETRRSSKPNVFEEFIGNKIDLNDIVELNEEAVLNCKNVRVSVVMTKSYHGTKEEFNKLIKQILTMYTFTSHSFINVYLENIHSIVVKDAIPYLPKTKDDQTRDLELSTNSISREEQCQLSREVLSVNPKTKLTIEQTYSVEYYKQLIRFGADCQQVEEFASCNSTWRWMKELIECRKRGLVNTGVQVEQDDGKRMNSANKILLVGPSGCGKSYMMRTLARACAVPLVCCHGNQFSASSPGASEQSLAERLEFAQKLAEENKGLCILLFEQIHDLCPSSPSLSHITRLSLTLTSLLDASPVSSRLFFVFTSTHAHQISSRLKTHSRLYLTAPNTEYRTSILSRELSILEESIRETVVVRLVHLTGSYLPVDLVRVCNMVMMYVAKHGQCKPEAIIAHMRSCLAHYRPSCLKVGSLGVIDLPSGGGGDQQHSEQLKLEAGETRTDEEKGLFETENAGGLSSEVGSDLGGLKTVRALIEKTVEWPFRYAKQFERLGIPRSKGILLYGPPGCAKTALVRSLAVSSSCRVLAVSAAQLYSPYVGEAEQNVAQLFHRARLSAPAILFIDEIDALVGNRSESSGKDVQQSVLSVFLNEMDGVGVKPDLGSSTDSTSSQVLVIAATNRPHMLDSALIRPGRLDKLIYVRPPDYDERIDILAKVSSRGRSRSTIAGQMERAEMCPSESPATNLSDESRATKHLDKSRAESQTEDKVDWEYLARNTEYYSGADLCNLYREAALLSLLDRGFDNTVILNAHWLTALSITRPSLTREQLSYYEQFEQTV
uniref:Spermatogenesis-associated protein 5-like protein 1 n=1 Tax=Cacopsylla melanoneura TaxID=428564 RepID=A0A8D8M7R3_9HEMI